MRRTAEIIFLVFFVIVALGELGSIVGLYTLSASHRQALLRTVPRVYWLLQFGQFLLAGLYVVGYINKFKNVTMASIVLLFIFLRLLSIWTLLGLRTIVTWGQIVGGVTFSIGGAAFCYHLYTGDAG